MALWQGGRVTPDALCVLAPNPGPMTLDGTNTWVLSAPGASDAVVVDPGPADPRHLDSVRAAVAEMEVRVSLVLLTHGHLDHSEGAATFAAQVGAPVRAWDPRHASGETIAAGEIIEAGGMQIQVLATPGHTSDSVTFAIPGAILTGDTVLGRGTTVVAHPDGTLGQYLASLELLRDHAGEYAAHRVLPGHGPVLNDPVAAINGYLDHRAERLAQIRSALLELPASGLTAEELTSAVVASVYAEVPREVWPAAAASVRAQLAYLGREG